MNVREWKERHTKTFTLTSGLEVTIRRLPGFAFGDSGPLPQLEEVPTEDQLRFAKTVVQKALLKPEVGDGVDQISLYDLTMEDINEIIEAVMKISGRPEDSPLAQTVTSESETQSSSTA